MTAADESRAPAAARYVRSPQADATRAGGSAVIYHRDTGSAITLNPAGTLLWERLATPATEAELVAVLMETWPSVSRETAQADVAAYVVELREHDLISVG